MSAVMREMVGGVARLRTNSQIVANIRIGVERVCSPLAASAPKLSRAALFPSVQALPFETAELVRISDSSMPSVRSVPTAVVVPSSPSMTEPFGDPTMVRRRSRSTSVCRRFVFERRRVRGCEFES